jgi:hypothetical protein
MNQQRIVRPNPRRVGAGTGKGLVRLLVAIGAVVVCGILIHEVRAALEAERNHQAALFAVRLVEHYVSEAGRWPGSWRDLEELPFAVRWDSQPWPEAAAPLKERVSIDFAIDPEKLAGQREAEFEAIKPLGPSFEYRFDGLVHALLQSVQKSLHSTP